MQQDELVKSVSFCSDEISDFEKSLDDVEVLMRKFEELKRDNDNMKKEMSNLNSRVNELEQHSESKNIVIQGVPENNNENLISIFEQISNFLGVEVKDNVEFANRVQSMKPVPGKPKNIVVGFASKILGDQVIALAKQKRKNSSNPKNGIKINEIIESVYINEHLTSNNQSLLREAKEAARTKNFKFVWVKNGNIFMREDERSRVKFAPANRSKLFRARNTILLKGETTHKSDLGVFKPFLNKGRSFHFKPYLLTLQVPVKKEKLQDVNKLLKHHFGENWIELSELDFYKNPLSRPVADQVQKETGEGYCFDSSLGETTWDKYEPPSCENHLSQRYKSIGEKITNKQTKEEVVIVDQGSKLFALTLQKRAHKCGMRT
ncbi:unnamed protein product [Phaedon cochleariae]|uniref:FP protein C-terminal domain-containing protein n=1 Tax=Phaedon cochleariae TaxID=80249 RepID=A0A9N9SIZ5_PHACE|nr:unnamed protein product [Phaedon cochleariae]